MQAKLNEGKLLNAFGNLNESGYSTSLIRDYDRRDIRMGKNRIKESDYYYIGNSRYAISINVSDYSKYGFITISLIDYEKNEVITRNLKKVFTNGKLKLPKSSINGDFVFNEDNITLKITNNGITRKIICKLDKFDGIADFECEIELQIVNRDSSVVALPLKNKKLFRYTQFIPSFKVRGSARVGGRRLSFSELDSFAILIWERSVTIHKLNIIKSFMSGIHNGKKIAFNFSNELNDETNVTENVIFDDNKPVKINEINFEIPTNEKGKMILMNDWKVFSNDKKVNLTFTPLINHKNKNSIIIASNTCHYLYGAYNGVIKVNDKDVRIENQIGVLSYTKLVR